MNIEDGRTETTMMKLWIPGSDPVNQAQVPREREDRMLAMSEQALQHEGNTVSAYFAIRNSVYRNLVVQEAAEEPADQNAQPLAVIRAIEVSAVHEARNEQVETEKLYSGSVVATATSRPRSLSRRWIPPVRSSLRGSSV